MTSRSKNNSESNHLVFWLVVPALLLGLNFYRDLNQLQKKYEWEAVDTKILHRGVSAPGAMEALRVVEIKSDVDEIVEKKMVQEGDNVKEGQPLVQLSRERTQLEFEQRRNGHMSIEADYKKAVRELSIQKKLLKNLAVSRQQVEDAQQALEKSKAAMDISKQELGLVQKKLDSTLVRSPMNGVVLKDYAKLGQPVSNGKEIITIGDVSKFIVRTKVDELDIDQIRMGQTVDITADAFPGKVMKGKVTAIASQAEREAFAKIEVLIDITDAAKLTLKHNLSVRINIVTEALPSSLNIPIKSVFRKNGDNGWVVTRTATGFVRQRRIKLGKTAGDRIQIISGLEAGELVGAEKVSDKPS